MNNFKKIAVPLAFLFSGLIAAPLLAQSVSARLSAREAFVGMPIVLQIQIANATDYELPEVGEIDGCDVRSAGAPSQSTQITIFNGRRSQSRSVTIQYLITPRREGTYEVPSLKVVVDGREQMTRPLRFVATKSETGDLLFVEIEGSKNKVYVGESLDLTLRIWVKPFRDRERQITLSEGQMWQCVSRQTAWGSFSEALVKMAENNQRPAGREVLREDGEGIERGYYLYEISGTVYPKRPGEIDASDVQVIFNYPTALGRSRDPFESMFGGRSIGRSSLLQQMMNDDFFSSSIGRSLTVSASRPVVGEAQVGSTEVVPIPTEGRPADYRGAVGRYQIVTNAEKTTVNAGDPLTFQIGIVGDGPMELVQAPPLSELGSLTGDFKVSGQPLAGFVRDETKVFSTKIRPRREGVTEIPPIPFSFFDPDAEAFETVYSRPIPIEVGAAETLALDAVFGNAGGRKSDSAGGEKATVANDLPNFENAYSESLLGREQPHTSFVLVWVAVVAPPLVWLALVAWNLFGWLFSRLIRFQPARVIAVKGIARSTTRQDLLNSLVVFLAARLRTAFSQPKTELEPDPSSQLVLGAMRTHGMGRAANQVESMFARLESEEEGDMGVSDGLKAECRELLSSLEKAFAESSRPNIRKDRRETAARGSRGKVARNASKAGQIAGLMVLLCWPTVGAAQEQMAGDQVPFSLTSSQQLAILDEADTLYRVAADSDDRAESQVAFTEAATKYQMLVDSGIENSELFGNLANAWLQSGQKGRAIANYRKALRLDPFNRQLQINLQFVESQLNSGEKENEDEEASDDETTGEGSQISGGRDGTWIESIGYINDQIVSVVGITTVAVLLAISSLLFWAGMIARTINLRQPGWRFIAMAFVSTLLFLASFWMASQPPANNLAIVVSESLEMRLGDGAEFELLPIVEQAEGDEVEVLGQRAEWVQIKTADGRTGWVVERDLVKI